MAKSFFITTHVIDTINALPADERVAVTTALAAELILGVEANEHLTPMQQVLYSMIRQYVHRDTLRLANPDALKLDCGDFDAGFLNAAV